MDRDLALLCFIDSDMLIFFLSPQCRYCVSLDGRVVKLIASVETDTTRDSPRRYKTIRSELRRVYGQVFALIRPNQ
jgi:hypothetical protein